MAILKKKSSSSSATTVPGAHHHHPQKQHPGDKTRMSHSGQHWLDDSTRTALTASSEGPEGSSSKSLGFGTIRVREYPRILGDNVTMQGPPISIAWQHETDEEYDLDEYDAAVRETRRNHAELKMPAQMRVDLLRGPNYEYTRKEILEATKTATIARNQRKWTIERLHFQSVHETLETLKRSCKLGKKKEKQRLLQLLDDSSSSLRVATTTTRTSALKSHKRQTL